MDTFDLIAIMVNSLHADTQNSALQQLKRMIFKRTSKSKQRQWKVRDFKIASCTRTSNSHVESVKHLIKKITAS